MRQWTLYCHTCFLKAYSVKFQVFKKPPLVWWWSLLRYIDGKTWQVELHICLDVLYIYFWVKDSRRIPYGILITHTHACMHAHTHPRTHAHTKHLYYRCATFKLHIRPQIEAGTLIGHRLKQKLNVKTSTLKHTITLILTNFPSNQYNQRFKTLSPILGSAFDGATPAAENDFFGLSRE